MHTLYDNMFICDSSAYKYRINIYVEYYIVSVEFQCNVMLII